MIKITVYNNPLQRDECEEIEGEALWPTLMVHFGEKFPKGARLYYQEEAEDHDITPLDEADALAIAGCPGPFIVRVGAGEVSFWTVVISATIAVLSAAASFLLAPSIPGGSTNTPSPSNQLGGRKNEARPGKRIEDIFGEVRSTITLLSVPLLQFIDGKEYEDTIGCIGRGAYDVSDLRDGTTPVSQIDGMSVGIYAPNTIPQHGSPQYEFGPSLSEPVRMVERINSVNGQTLYAPNYKRMMAADYGIDIGSGLTGRVWFSAETIDSELILTVYISDAGNIPRFPKVFEEGDVITLSGCDAVPGRGSGDGTVNLNGICTVRSFPGDREMRLAPSDPTGTQYMKDHFFSTDSAPYDLANFFVADADREIGPFRVHIPASGEVWVNCVGTQGLFSTDSGGRQKKISIDFAVSVTPVGGSTVTTTATMTGIAGQTLSGLTVKTADKTAGDYDVTVKRVTPKVTTDDLTYTDTVQCRDLYIVSPLPGEMTSFGNVTTVQTRTPATPAALGVKERKLNMNVVRKVKTLNSDGTFGTGHTTFALAPLVASKNVADIFCFAALDDRIGRQTEDQIDGAQIYAEIAAVKAYFGTDEAVQFGFTFDDDDISGEDILNAIAQAAFCEPCRRGELIQLVFERATDSSTMVLGHRTSFDQKRSDVFGTVNDSDGIELNYPDKDNYDAPATYRIPADGSATRPKKIDSIGRRNFSQVYWYAWREYNKILYQNLSCEVTALESASILTRLERVAVADNTEPCVIPGCALDGEVRAQSGLTLTLSQKVPFEDGKAYAIILQHKDATTEAIGITAGSTPKQVVLANAPNQSLVFGKKQNTTYLISVDEDETNTAFLVSEKTEADGNNYALKLVNYDARYYAKDLTTPE